MGTAGGWLAGTPTGRTPRPSTGDNRAGVARRPVCPTCRFDRRCRRRPLRRNAGHVDAFDGCRAWNQWVQDCCLRGHRYGLPAAAAYCDVLAPRHLPGGRRKPSADAQDIVNGRRERRAAGADNRGPTTGALDAKRAAGLTPRMARSFHVVTDRPRSSPSTPCGPDLQEPGPGRIAHRRVEHGRPVGSGRIPLLR